MGAFDPLFLFERIFAWPSQLELPEHSECFE